MAEKKTNKRTPAAGGGSSGPVGVGWLEQVVRLMADHDLNTVDVRDGATRIVLKRGQPVVTVAGLPATTGLPAPSAAAAPSARAAPAAAPADEEAGLVPIRSVMVGTFYAAPKPGEKPFVAVGSRVVKDETDVCVIEAMKNFFPQKADVTGTIAKILVENGHPVQVEQPLFLVRPA